MPLLKQTISQHAPVTVLDSPSVDFTLTGQQVTAAVLPAGVDHNSLNNLTTGDPHTQYLKETDFTAGSVLFRGASAISEDNTNLVWDNSNKQLNVRGIFSVRQANATLRFIVYPEAGLSVFYTYLDIRTTGDFISHQFAPYFTSYVQLAPYNFGIGLANPGRKCDVLDTSNPQQRWTHTAGSVYGEVQATSNGYLEFNATGNRILLGKDDNDRTYWGAGYDFSAYYDGTVAHLKTDEVAASDLKITTGTGKTVVYNNTPFEDLNFSPLTGSGNPSTLPAVVRINGVDYREFASSNDEEVGDTQEIYHAALLGQTLNPHCHIFLKSGESAGTTGATFTIYWDLRDTTGSTSGSEALSATSAQLTANPYKFDIYASTGFTGSSQLGAQLSLRIARTGGDAGDVIVMTYGVHVACDTPGSRTATNK